mgnify:CR=1
MKIRTSTEWWTCTPAELLSTIGRGDSPLNAGATAGYRLIQATPAERRELTRHGFAALVASYRPRGPRPRLGTNTVNRTIEFPCEMESALQAEADSLRVSFSEIVRRKCR